MRSFKTKFFRVSFYPVEIGEKKPHVNITHLKNSCYEDCFSLQSLAREVDGLLSLYNISTKEAVRIMAKGTKYFYDDE